MSKDEKTIGRTEESINNNVKQPMVVLTSVTFHNVNKIIPIISKRKDTFIFEERDRLTRQLTKYINEGFNLNISDFEYGNRKLEESITTQIIEHTDSALYNNLFRKKAKLEKWAKYFKDYNIKEMTNWSFVSYISQGKVYLDLNEWDTAGYKDYLSYVNNHDNFDFDYIVKWK